VKTLQCFQSSQFKFAIIGKGLKHPLVDALPNSTAIFHHRSMATPGILTTSKTLGERMGKYKLVLRGFGSSAKLKREVWAKPPLNRQTGFKLVTPRFLAVSFDFTCPATGYDETWAKVIQNFL